MRRLTETQPLFVTSEFFEVLAALVALAVTTASSDPLDAGLLWPQPPVWLPPVGRYSRSARPTLLTALGNLLANCD